ncbi:unnamed protein product [Heterobilharzia americana]|nr:unnamed protein product [Heterobilharzia americana]
MQISELDGCVTLKRSDSGDDPPKCFIFDFVFGCNSKQTDIYNRVARPIVEKVLEGYNGNVLNNDRSFYRKLKRNYICLRPNRNRKNIYNGRGSICTGTEGHNTEFICTYIWGNRKG